MNVRYRVELSQAERCEPSAMLSKGKRAARKLKRAQILLAADARKSTLRGEILLIFQRRILIRECGGSIPPKPANHSCF